MTSRHGALLVIQGQRSHRALTSMSIPEIRNGALSSNVNVNVAVEPLPGTRMEKVILSDEEETTFSTFDCPHFANQSLVKLHAA